MHLDLQIQSFADVEVPEEDPIPRFNETGGVISDYSCDLTNIKLAGIAGMYGTGDQCDFVQEQGECDPQGNFDFLRLYYCDFFHAFG